MKVQFNTNILLWDQNDNGLWLDEMGYQSEDCGIFNPITIDSITSDSVSINGILYSFNLEGIFEDDHDFEEFPLYYLVD